MLAPQIQTHYLQQIQGGQQIEISEHGNTILIFERTPNHAVPPRNPCSESMQTHNPNLLASLNLLEIPIMNTNRRRFKPICPTATVLLTFGLIASLLPGVAAADAPRPHIAFIFTDDQRVDAIGAVDEALITPNLDRLAARGTRFANALVTLSICSPSRAAVMTGNHAKPILVSIQRKRKWFL